MIGVQKLAIPSCPPAKCPPAKHPPFSLDLPAVIVIFIDILPNLCFFGKIKQICHASVGILMERLPSGGWFSLGLRPRTNHPTSGRHSIRIPTLAWHICILFLCCPRSVGIKWCHCNSTLKCQLTWSLRQKWSEGNKCLKAHRLKRPFSAIKYYQKVVYCHGWKTIKRHKHSLWKKKKRESKSRALQIQIEPRDLLNGWHPDPHIPLLL